MEQHHRKLINKRMSELVSVTFDVKAIVDILFDRVVINEWMKDYILVRLFHLIVDILLSHIKLFMIYKYFNLDLYCCRVMREIHPKQKNCTK